jgi:hypothetical protein
MMEPPGNPERFMADRGNALEFVHWDIMLLACCYVANASG